MPESTCSAPLPFTQERFRPTGPKYRPEHIYGVRAFLNAGPVNGQVPKFRVWTDVSIEGWGFQTEEPRPAISIGGSGRSMTFTLWTDKTIKFELDLVGTAPNKVLCIDAVTVETKKKGRN